MPTLKIILLSSAFNGLTQRAWLDLREAGYHPSVVLFTDPASVCRQIEESGAHLVICPFLKDRVPEQLWRNPRRPVVIIHPGIVGDRGRQRPGLGDHSAARTLGCHGVAGGRGNGRRASLGHLRIRPAPRPAQIRAV